MYTCWQSEGEYFQRISKKTAGGIFEFLSLFRGREHFLLFSRGFEFTKGDLYQLFEGGFYEGDFDFFYLFLVKFFMGWFGLLKGNGRIQEGKMCVKFPAKGTVNFFLPGEGVILYDFFKGFNFCFSCGRLTLDVRLSARGDVLFSFSSLFFRGEWIPLTVLI